MSTNAPLSPDSTDICTIVVIYEGDKTRARALDACDYLVNQFWQDVEMKFHWWRLDFLDDATLADAAAVSAIKSDFLIVCLEPGDAVSPAMESWFEKWIGQRGELEGALVNLASESPQQIHIPQVERFLKQICQRGNFDYLTSVPIGVAVSRPNAGTIDDILGESRPPSHYGLNE